MNGFDAELSAIQMFHLGSTGWFAVRRRAQSLQPLEYSAEEFSVFTNEADGAGTLCKCSVCYSIRMISHAGRALRMTPNLWWYTNGVLPHWGTVCLNSEVVTGSKGVSIIRGTVRHRTSKEEQRGGMSVFEIRIRDAYDMDEHGLLKSFLGEIRDRVGTEP